MGDLGKLDDAGPDKYILIAGTAKVVSGTGTITRVIAVRKNLNFDDDK